MHLELADIHKRYGRTFANRAVNLSLEPGMIHGLLGENAAGKTTLMRVAAGYTRPDRGEVRLDGRAVSFDGPAQALALGVGMLSQDPLDFPALPAWENFVLGGAAGAGDRARATALLASLCAEHGLSLDPQARVGDLTVAERQQLDLARLLSLDVRALILDEPSTGVSQARKGALFALLRRLADQGRVVVMVSHKLPEAMAVCDRIAVLRRGQVAATFAPPYAAGDILRAMFGGPLPHPVPEQEEDSGLPGSPDAADHRTSATSRAENQQENLEKKSSSPRAHPESQPPGPGIAPPAAASRPPAAATASSPEPDAAASPPLLSLDRAVFEDEEARLAPVSLSLAPGQALGLAGVEGSGREVFVRGLAGLGRLAAGTYALAGKPLRTRRIAPLRRAGIAYLPAARMETGLFPDMSVLDHLALAFGASPARARELFRRRCLDELAMTATPDTLARGLSGGNQQRLLLAMIPEDVRLLLIEHPTRGLDLESQDLVWRRLTALRETGAALVFLTDDLDELLAQAGQAGVFHNRTLAACLPVAGLARSRVESLMVGVEK